MVTILLAHRCGLPIQPHRQKNLLAVTICKKKVQYPSRQHATHCWHTWLEVPLCP